MENANVTFHRNPWRQHFAAARPQALIRSPARNLSQTEKKSWVNLLSIFAQFAAKRHHSHLAPPGLRLVTCSQLQLHVQTLVCQLSHAAVCLCNGWRWSRTHTAMLPAPVAATATVRQFPSTTLHIQWAIWTVHMERLRHWDIFLATGTSQQEIGHIESINE